MLKDHTNSPTASYDAVGDMNGNFEAFSIQPVAFEQLPKRDQRELSLVLQLQDYPIFS